MHMITKDYLNGKIGITTHATNSNNQLQPTIMGYTELKTHIGSRTTALSNLPKYLGKSIWPRHKSPGRR